MSTIDAYLPFGLTADTALVGLAGLAAFVSVLAVWMGLLASDPAAARVRALTQRRRELQRQMHAAPSRAKRQQAGFMAQAVARLKLARTSQSEKIRDKLVQAGKRSREAMVVYLFCKPVMPLLFAALGFLAIYGLGFGDLPATLRPAAMLAAVLLGFYAPDIYLSNLAKKRQQAMQKSLPDGLDLLVICAEAGLSLDTALTRVADEIGPSSPELAEEFGLTAVELNFLPDRRQALQNLGRRCGIPAMRGVVNTLTQTEKYGTPLSQSLRVLSGEFREQRMLRAEEKAARLPATLTVPMIVFILPTLFVVLAGPAMLSVYDNLIKN
ncbi:MAG TPA: type II secretion system F family protein [Geminicoccaceae bacterium]|nr:type II secretion system F family protein [Geminicoccus sp.]HMU50036.1 type II secretion system F family protein [Geminicoccaceae bacterium]